MAPKEKPKVDKVKQAAKAKAAEDKTFGLKNKNKSSKVQKFVQQVTQVNTAPKVAPAKDKKKSEEEKAKELQALFAVAIKQPKVPAGVDPKSIVCEFFRHNQCTKGFKCKFAHDLSVERRGAKIDLFTDQRDVSKDGEGGMEDWDQETLEQAIKEKHGKEAPNKTDIICKHFLEAVEKALYGWFWKCPAGEDCKYRHALPPGYVLKSQMKALLEEAAKEQRDLTEVIEEERARVDAKTPITESTFRVWHKARQEARHQKKEADEAERKKKGVLNGRELFLQEGFEAQDDASAADEYIREDEEAVIQDMMNRAAADLKRAREEAAAAAASSSNGHGEAESSSHAEGEARATHSRDNGEGPSTNLHLNEDEAALFMDDDDEDEDMDEEDEEDGEEVDALGEQVRKSQLEPSGDAQEEEEDEWS